GLHEGMRDGGASARFRELHQRHGAPAGLEAGLYLDYKTFLADDVLALSDRLAMAHSLEIRVPFVDHVLVERVFPLPDRIKTGCSASGTSTQRSCEGSSTITSRVGTTGKVSCGACCASRSGTACTSKPPQRCRSRDARERAARRSATPERWATRRAPATPDQL